MNFRPSLLLASLLIAPPMFANAAGKTVPTPPPAKASEEAGRETGGGTATLRDFDYLLADSLAAGIADTPQLRESIRQRLTARDLLVAEARRTGLDREAETKARMRMAEKDALAHRYELRYLAEHPASEEQLRAAYDLLHQRMGDSEFHLRQLAVASDAEAQALIARLRQGSSFAELADGQSARNGGDLGWVSPLQLPSVVRDAVRGLQKGQYTPTPVHDGQWFVLLLEDVRPFEFPAYAQLKPALQREYARQIMSAHIEILRGGIPPAP